MTGIVHPTRRNLLRFLAAGAALGTFGRAGLSLADAATDRRLVIIIQRGAMDGLGSVPPYGDALYLDRRKSLALPMPGETDGILKLDGTFGLHPTLTAVAPLWQAGELAIVPATSGGYHTRSHFDAQDMLETGYATYHGDAQGWVNRALAVLPPAHGQRLGLALGDEVPLSLRGKIPVANWAPPDIRAAAPGLLATMTALYANDPVFGPALADGVKAQNLSDEVLGSGNGKNPAMKGGAFHKLADAAGGLLAAEDGPRVAVLDIGGWDTHVGQGTVKGRLAAALGMFNDGIQALQARLGPAWSKTVVVTVTEFGRTVSPNGTGGTDHGTASVTLVMGGAVKGGRIAADWVGLDRLEENRDLRVGTDIRAVLKGVLRDHMGISTADLDAKVFPDSAGVRPLSGLVRA